MYIHIYIYISGRVRIYTYTYSALTCAATRRSVAPCTTTNIAQYLCWAESLSRSLCVCRTSLPSLTHCVIAGDCPPNPNSINTVPPKSHRARDFGRKKINSTIKFDPHIPGERPGDCDVGERRRADPPAHSHTHAHTLTHSHIPGECPGDSNVREGRRAMVVGVIDYVGGSGN